MVQDLPVVEVMLVKGEHDVSVRVSDKVSWYLLISDYFKGNFQSFDLVAYLSINLNLFIHYFDVSEH